MLKADFSQYPLCISVTVHYVQLLVGTLRDEPVLIAQSVVCHYPLLRFGRIFAMFHLSHLQFHEFCHGDKSLVCGIAIVICIRIQVYSSAHRL